MDDFNVSSLHESKNEWSARLLTILTPLIIDGYKSILDEAVKLCIENNERDKYLMTFQNFISRVPKWNSTIIEQERKRIIDKSGCSYLEDLVSCVHIIQLKILTAMRVGQKQKRIDINIPKLDDFVHKIYINVARKIYKNVYLFELSIPPLQIQKNHRELEIIIQECILNTLRESIPVESILKAYMDETVEEEVQETVEEKIIHEPTPVNASSLEIPSQQPQTEINSNNIDTGDKTLKFNDLDMVRDENNKVENIPAPKSIDRLEEISELRNIQRKSQLEEEEDDNDFYGGKLNISDQHIELNNLDVHNIDQDLNLLPELLLDDIEVLE